MRAVCLNVYSFLGRVALAGDVDLATRKLKEAVAWKRPGRC